MDLGSLGNGQMGIVSSLVAQHHSTKRLADMGFVPGAELFMVKPGDPCIVRIDETSVALGAGHQHSIQVDPR